MSSYVQTTHVENRGATSPWGQNFNVLAGWFKAEEDDQIHLTYGHDIKPSYGTKIDSTVSRVSPRAPWTNYPAFSPITTEWATKILELGLKRTEQAIEDCYRHLVLLLPFLLRPKAFGLRNLFCTRRPPLDIEKWISMIPNGYHSCLYCQNLFIDAAQLEPAIEHQSKTFAMADVAEAANGGCSIFKWLEKNTQKFDLPSDARTGFSLRLTHPHGNRNDISSIKFTYSDSSHETHSSMKTFVTSDAPAAEYIDGRPPNSDVASRENFELSIQWLKECHRAHVPCRGSNRGYMPTRVLKIEGDKVNLMETEGNQEGKYAALSYCWGGSQDFTLTTDNVAACLLDIPTMKLPQTIKDAVTVTKELGLSYLWVDSLCTIQNDVKDQEREIKLMSEVYETAYVTISAASAKTCREGFLAPRQPEIATIPYILPNGELGALNLHQGLEAADEPIHSRAWTLQEHINACRILEYGSQQLRRICRDPRQSTGLQGLKQLAPRVDPAVFGKCVSEIWREPDKVLRHCWQPLVKNYTQRCLQMPEDKPRAIHAIAMEYKKRMHSDYKAGLWKRSLKQELLWQRDESDTSRQPRRLDYRCPSWTWLSVDSAVIVWNVLRKDVSDESLKVVHCHSNDRLWYAEELPDPSEVEVSPPDISYLCVEGRTRQALWIPEKGKLVSDCADRPFADVVVDVPGEVDISQADGVVVTCLEVQKYTAGLVLLNSNRPSRIAGFQRIGLWTICHDKDQQSKGIKEGWLEHGKKTRLYLY
ncbi:hypothetical protein AK830_g2023 [Neonectria ditissima]|uniref:Heterokaryon incompatibility domain-containing protein n=1 Tax=Neonectria ditissima TaxID=78410 RepID=A0A0P7BSZ9_9HYPO|nr:hypothetical protein AK830_g2023 [Neonectria ditissima]